MKWGVWVLCASLVLAGCSTTRVAPIVDMNGTRSVAVKRNTQPAPGKIGDWRPATHEIQKGETLYNIALEYGLDYRELAAWNNLTDLNRIQVGQTLRLTAPNVATAAMAPMADDTKVQIVPLKPSAIAIQPLLSTLVIAQPLAIKLAYSEAAIAKLQHGEDKPVVKPLIVKPEVLPSPLPPAAEDNHDTKLAAVQAEKPPEVAKETVPKEADDTAIDWMWPTKGPVITQFSEARANKGIDISGNRGQPVYAAAAGKVVYSGSGLRGYGKLVIIKHNAMYLTAYAHNARILVKEGQMISRGQKIAEMGDSDADQVKLHFEVRQMGKPVDPLKYLPEATK